MIRNSLGPKPGMMVFIGKSSPFMAEILKGQGMGQEREDEWPNYSGE